MFLATRSVIEMYTLITGNPREERPAGASHQVQFEPFIPFENEHMATRERGEDFSMDVLL